MCGDTIKLQLNEYEDEFKNFMGITKFPMYKLQTKKVSLNLAERQGYEVLASASYQPETNSHTLVVTTNLPLSKHLLFHEFTHMFDVEMYVNGNKIRYAGISGFTEYHASQIELMQLLGAKYITDTVSFSMNTIIDTLTGKKSVSQYLSEKQQHAIQLFSRNSFPDDLSTLKTAIGLLYNYWGIRSVCEMYSTNYTETINNDAFLSFIPSFDFSAANRLMHGWLNGKSIESSITLYFNILFPLIKNFKLA